MCFFHVILFIIYSRYAPKGSVLNKYNFITLQKISLFETSLKDVSNLKWRKFYPTKSLDRQKIYLYSTSKSVFKNFKKFIGKRLCWSLFLIKLQAFKAWNFVKKRLQHRCFPLNIAKYLRTVFL